MKYFIRKLSIYLEIYAPQILISQILLEEIIFIALKLSHHFLIFFLVGLAFTLAITVLLKILTNVNRPKNSFIKYNDKILGESFPSLHSALTSYLASSFLFFKPLFLIFVIWAVFVAFSRVYLRMHRINEVLFGFALGFILGLILNVFFFGSKILLESAI
ncbi:MAG: phosphatase PAP2 family protein [Candidatus Parvarchaeota archaeon]|nr:phosphatase PAP2 family protein [Candidatus Rehaiarchaeum fermentans]